MSDQQHCEGTSSYDCKLGTCHGLPQCGTCCKCKGLCIIEQNNLNKPPTPPKPGEMIAIAPAQMAETLKGFVWAVVVDGNTHDATFTGELTANGSLQAKLGKKHTPPTPKPSTEARRV